MASPQKNPNGTWRIQFMVSGQRVAGTFPTKRAADEFKAKKTAEILAQTSGKTGTVKTLLEALDEYALKVSPTKRGNDKEQIRLVAFKGQDHKLPLKKKLSDITKGDLAEWRDRRLALNSRGSVLRDMTLLGHVFEVARRDWEWIEVNPMRDVKRPGEPDHRERVISPREIRRMLRAMKYSPQVRSVSNAVAHCFLLALSTGMRAGELCAIKWGDVKKDYVVLHVSKTGSGRDVPVSPVGLRIIERMRGWDDEFVFGMKSQSLDANFRKYRERAGLSGFTFHDARHTAATRLAVKPGINPLILCKIFGWKQTKMALTYFNPTASQMAGMLV